MLHEWGLGGRRFGTVITWFLVGGDVYTAYTFIAVPALRLWRRGRRGLRRPVHDRHLPHPLPGVSAPLVRLPQARLHHLGRLREGSLRQSLAGTRDHHHRHRRDDAVYRAAASRHPGSWIGALGISGTGLVADLPLLIAFVILAAFTYSGGLRAPASIAIVKDILIYITAFAAIIVIPAQLGGFGKDLRRRVPPANVIPCGPGAQHHGQPTAPMPLSRWGRRSPCSSIHTASPAILSASSSGKAIRRNAAMLPGYTFMLGLLALIGFFAVAAGVGKLARIRR